MKTLRIFLSYLLVLAPVTQTCYSQEEDFGGYFEETAPEASYRNTCCAYIDGNKVARLAAYVPVVGLVAAAIILSTYNSGEKCSGSSSHSSSSATGGSAH